MTPRLGWPVIGAAWLALELVTLRRQQTHGINDTASECTATSGTPAHVRVASSSAPSSTPRGDLRQAHYEGDLMNFLTDLVPAKHRKKVHRTLAALAALFTLAASVYVVVDQNWGDWPAILLGLAGLLYTASNDANTDGDA